MTAMTAAANPARITSAPAMDRSCLPPAGRATPSGPSAGNGVGASAVAPSSGLAIAMATTSARTARSSTSLGWDKKAHLAIAALTDSVCGRSGVV
uniref:Uncharacterized protein n=1 Tax=Triticum urartu TaxID=4572 RepID=A0A8R7P768_TRIUA